MTKAEMPPKEELIGKYINHYMWSDVYPIGKITDVKGTVLTLAKVHYKRDESVVLNFEVGGFSAHCSNSRAQKWIYTVDEEDTFTLRYSKSLLKRHRIEDKPYHYYDYNF